MSEIPKADWRWYGSAGHFICGHDCRFHLCTEIGEYLVSTVGELWPARAVREIHAQVHDPEWLAANQSLKGDYFDAAYMKRFGYETVGYDRKYETMVFRAGKRCEEKECGCGLPRITGHELLFDGYNRADDATRGHHAMCERVARGEFPEESE